MRIACPPTPHPCFYGVDTPERAKLLAAQMDVARWRRSSASTALPSSPSTAFIGRLESEREHSTATLRCLLHRRLPDPPHRPHRQEGGGKRPQARRRRADHPRRPGARPASTGLSIPRVQRRPCGPGLRWRTAAPITSAYWSGIIQATLLVGTKLSLSSRISGLYQDPRVLAALGQFLEQHLALQARKMVDEQHAVEVIDLVLQAPREARQSGPRASRRRHPATWRGFGSGRRTSAYWSGIDRHPSL